ncbi:hypothetical protein RDABS01_024549 [Bienertia sinuspersici]
MEFFLTLPLKGLHPNSYTYYIIIKGLCKDGFLNEATELLRSMEDNGCPPDACTYNTIIRRFLYGKHISKALEFVTTMRRKGAAADMHTTFLFVSLIMDHVVGDSGKALLQNYFEI